MDPCFFHLAFIGPGGPEFLLVMLVLLMLFGAKDAPRILRKLNEIINQIRNTADGFKREVMYGDLNNDTPDYEDDYSDEDGYSVEDDYFGEDEDAVEEDDLDGDAREEPEPGPEAPTDEEDDAEKA